MRSGWKKVNDYERRAILALMRHTTLNDREIADLLGRGLWTIYHIRTAAGIPATNKGRTAWAALPDAGPGPDIRDYWRTVDPAVCSAERSEAAPQLATPHPTWVHPYARRSA